MSFCHCSINWRTMTNIRPPLSHFLPGLKLSSCHICHGARYCRNHSIHLTHGVITPLMGHSLNFPENTKTQHTWVAESKFGVFTIICVEVWRETWYLVNNGQEMKGIFTLYICERKLKSNFVMRFYCQWIIEYAIKFLLTKSLQSRYLLLSKKSVSLLTQIFDQIVSFDTEVLRSMLVFIFSSQFTEYFHRSICYEYFGLFLTKS